MIDCKTFTSPKELCNFINKDNSKVISITEGQGYYTVFYEATACQIKNEEVFFEEAMKCKTTFELLNLLSSKSSDIRKQHALMDELAGYPKYFDLPNDYTRALALKAEMFISSKDVIAAIRKKHLK